MGHDCDNHGVGVHVECLVPRRAQRSSHYDSCVGLFAVDSEHGEWIGETQQLALDKPSGPIDYPSDPTVRVDEKRMDCRH